MSRKLQILFVALTYLEEGLRFETILTWEDGIT
jgi:hypothetical protein